MPDIRSACLPPTPPLSQADYKFCGLILAGVFATVGSLSYLCNHKLQHSIKHTTRYVWVYAYKSAPSCEFIDGDGSHSPRRAKLQLKSEGIEGL